MTRLRTKLPTPIVHLREADVTGGDSFHTT